MAVGKRIYAAKSYIRWDNREIVPGDKVSEGHPVLKEYGRYFEPVGVEPVAPPKKK